MPVTHKPLLAVLKGARQPVPPVWMMRQAGRYLPEYREVRAKAGSFLDLCYNPPLAAEVTLQPIRRFGFDGAILFSDILVVPHALGQHVTFEAGEGPRLDALPDRASLSRLSDGLDPKVTDPIYETVRLVKAALPAETTFLGFCGAPFTVASYMVAGRGGDDQEAARLFAYRDPDGFGELIDRLVQASISYLAGQFRAGVDAVQIFDSWASVLPDHELERWSIEPIRRIVEGVRAQVPDAPIIVFAKGGGLTAQARRAGHTRRRGRRRCPGRSRLGGREVQPHAAVQGPIDPMALLAGGAALDEAVDLALEAFAGGRYVFNLGHGITPPTPIAHVERMLARVRAYRG